MRKVDFSPPCITEDDVSAVVDTLRSGWITTGPRTKEFERKITSYCESKGTVCLNSGTAALELTLRLLGVGEGDEVITSSFTYSASASIINHVGAKIVLVDTYEDSTKMDKESLEEKITSRTKAIILVDIAGNVEDYHNVFSIIKRKQSIFKASNSLQKQFGRVVLISDGAHSFGAYNANNEKSGSIADFTCFSFHAVKNLTTSEGGAVTWKRTSFENDFYKRYQLLSLHGQNKSALDKVTSASWEYDIIMPGYKYNMTDIAASLGISQLMRYSDILQRRSEIAEFYSKFETELGFKLMLDQGSSNHLAIFHFEKLNEDKRNQLYRIMSERGISCNVHYKPLPLMTAYKELGFNIKDFKNSHSLFKSILTLPLHSELSTDDLEYIIENLKEALRIINYE